MHLNKISNQALKIINKHRFKYGEQWKYTDIKALNESLFADFSTYNINDSSEEINYGNLENDSLYEKIVFKDGICLAKTFEKNSYASNIINDNEVSSETSIQIKNYLTKLTALDENFFAALNTAFFSFGTFIYIPNNTTISKPIHISMNHQNSQKVM